MAAVLREISFSPVFRDWITTIYSSICLAVKLNSNFLEPFSIKCLVYQELIFFSLIYFGFEAIATEDGDFEELVSGTGLQSISIGF